MKRLMPLLLLLFFSAAAADSGAYRVEVIVFRNLDVVAEPAVVEQLRSFSGFPDLQQEPPAGELPDTAQFDPEPGLPAAQADIYRANLPDDLEVITGKSTLMDNIWRRLRSSKGYRPLLYSAWQQNRVDYYPPVHIHDQQLLDSQLRPPTAVMVADLTADDPLSAYRSNLYQLDGSAQLRRSRFLHLDLDLELREKPQGTVTEAAYSNPVFSADDNTHYQVFSLDQSRQVQTDRVQYFDTPYFGALVLVTTIQAD